MALNDAPIDKNLQHDEGMLSLYVAYTALSPAPGQLDERAGPRHEREDPVLEVLRCLPEAS